MHPQTQQPVNEHFLEREVQFWAEREEALQSELFPLDSQPDDEPIIITQAQLDDWRGLVSDLVVIARDLELQQYRFLGKYIASPINNPDLLYLGMSDALLTGKQAIRSVLALHPSIGQIK